MNSTIIYPFPKIPKIDPEDLKAFIKDSFIKEFGENRLIDIKLFTYPHEYSADLIVKNYDEEVFKFLENMMDIFSNNGLFVMLFAHEPK